MTYTLKTKFSDCILRLNVKNACKEAIDWSEKFLSENKDITLGEAIEAYLKDGEVTEAWAAWCITTFETELDGDVRKKLIGKIKSEMVAFNLYRNLLNLDSQDDLILKSKFEGKLPTAEKELSEGVVTRRRDT